MTLAEKLAFARERRGQAGRGRRPPPSRPRPRPPLPPAAAAARALPPLDKMTDPKDLAEAARQAAAKRAKDEAAAKAAAARRPRPSPRRPSPRPCHPGPAANWPPPGPRPAPVVSRRGFFVGSFLVSWIAVAWVTFTAGLVAMTQMTVRFMFPNVLAEPPSTVKIGLASNFDPEEVSDRFKAEWGFWVVRSTKYNGQDILYALQSICTHLGCPPNWLASEQKFKCPCHGSGFYISGINFEGPRPGPSNGSRSPCPTTARSSLTRARDSSRSWASGPTRIASFRPDRSAVRGPWPFRTRGSRAGQRYRAFETPLETVRHHAPRPIAPDNGRLTHGDPG